MKIRTLAIASMLLAATSALQAQNFELAYDGADGSLDLVNVAGTNATTVEIVSDGGQLRGEKNPAIFAGLFDVYNANKAFKLDPAGFGSIDNFAFLDAGITDASTVDLVVDGSLVGGGPLGTVAITGIDGPVIEPPPAGDGPIIWVNPNGTLDFAANGTTVTTLEITSAASLFTGAKADFPYYTGLFDVYTAEKAFKLDPGGFGDLPGFASVAAGTDAAALIADFGIDGSVAGGGPLPATGIQNVPEPASVTLVGMGILALGLVRRRRS